MQKGHNIKVGTKVFYFDTKDGELFYDGVVWGVNGSYAEVYNNILDKTEYISLDNLFSSIEEFADHVKDIVIANPNMTMRYAKALEERKLKHIESVNTMMDKK